MEALPIIRDHPFDPPAALTRMAAEGPLHPLAFPDGHAGWLVTDLATAKAVLSDTRFSARQELRHMPYPHPLGQESATPAVPGWFIRMDPPLHTRYRRLLTGQFTVRRINRLIPRIEEIAEDALNKLERAGSPADLVEHFALPIPSLVICELLGIPYEDRERFQRTTGTALRLDADKDDVIAALMDLNEFFVQLVAAKRADPGDDLLGGLITSEELTDDELRAIGMLLLVAGHETTANMIALGTWTLLRHPEQLEALRADPALIGNAVEELLRYLSIIQFGAQRAALEDVTLNGTPIRAGQTLVISIPAANRDAARFPDPDALNLARDAAGHLGFGHGVHQCLGQQLARIEMRVAYAALLRRFPDLRMAVPDEEVPLRTDMAIYGVHSLPVAF
ncbi:cytochrome P450 [Nonomuraea sp. NPDC004297]